VGQGPQSGGKEGALTGDRKLGCPSRGCIFRRVLMAEKPQNRDPRLASSCSAQGGHKDSTTTALGQFSYSMSTAWVQHEYCTGTCV